MSFKRRGVLERREWPQKKRKNRKGEGVSSASILFLVGQAFSLTASTQSIWWPAAMTTG
jgi:hypothetical protein